MKGKLGIFPIETMPSFSFKDEWTSSTTFTSTVTKTYNMKQGERCAATSIQANVACFGGVSLLGKAVWIIDEGRKEEFDAQGLKQRFTGQEYQSGCVIDGIEDTLRALADGSHVRMDLGSEATGTPWTVEGCMFV